MRTIKDFNGYEYGEYKAICDFDNKIREMIIYVGDKAKTYGLESNNQDEKFFDNLVGYTEMMGKLNEQLIELLNKNSDYAQSLFFKDNTHDSVENK